VAGLLGKRPSPLAILGEARKIEVWRKAIIIPGEASLAHLWRWDAYYDLIYFPDHGKRDSDYGWEFDHYPVPKWMGGRDIISNLRPLHWRNNNALGGLGGLGGLLKRRP
jgi:hypothetical protein